MSTAKAKPTTPRAAAPAPAAANDAALDATKGYEKAVALTKDQVEAAVKAQTQAAKSYEDAIAAAKENLEALTKSGAILSRGVQDLSQTLLGLTQETIEETVAASKQMMAAKTLRELFDLQANTAKATFDKLMSESTRLSDLSVKLVEEAFAPISERVHATVDTLVKPAA